MNEHDIWMNRIAPALDRRLSGLVEKPSTAQAVLRIAKGEDTPMKKKLSFTLVLAIMLALVLAGVALAAGLGVFGQFADNEQRKQRMEKLDTHARAYDAQVTIPSASPAMPLPAEDDYQRLVKAQYDRAFQFTLEQAYVDKTSLYFSYTLQHQDAEPVFGEGLPTGAFEWQDMPGARWADTYSIGDGQDDRKYAQWLDGHEGGSYIIHHNVGVGDGANLKDGTVLDIIDGDSRRMEDGSIQGYMECQLPENLPQGEELDIQVDLFYGSTVIYQDKQGVRTAYVTRPDNRGIEYFDFTVFRDGTTTSVRGRRRDIPSPDGKTFAEAFLSISQVDAKGHVRLHVPKSWTQVWNMLGDGDGPKTTDYIMDFVLYADGTAYPNRDGGVTVVDDTHLNIGLRFDLPRDAKKLILRPIYRHSGEKAEADIVLE
ncbi:MAG: hypothetical protein GX650_06810 [Clostridiales bacterium]|nr:hypothetical protein [Clostridiales bacterium]